MNDSTILKQLLFGAAVTAEITVAAAMLSLLLSFTAAVARLYGPLPVRVLAVAYIEIFRGTSLLVQLFWLFYVLPHFGIELSPIWAGILSLGLNIGAYGAEIFRSAFQSVSRLQWEATVALNMRPTLAFRRIILPQSLTIAVPPFGNLMIELLKNTSLVSMISIMDLMFRSQQVIQATFKMGEVLAAAFLLYFAMAAFITILTRAIERWLNAPRVGSAL